MTFVINPDYVRLYLLKKKSKNMNLKFKSSEPDLKFNIQSQIKVINGNILYLTREVDSLVRMVKQMTNDKGLQLQVDKYFENDKDTEHIPEEDIEPD